MDSARNCENHIVLGRMKIDGKGNETTAIPRLLDLLVIKGCIATMDAMGCRKETASAIVGKDADCILVVKGNHGKGSTVAYQQPEA